MSALDAVRRALDENAEPDDALRAVVQALVEDGGCDWAGILFVEHGELVLGPDAGRQSPTARTQAPVEFQGERIAELVADGCPDPALLGSSAALITELCLVGWDTGGVPWDPAA